MRWPVLTGEGEMVHPREEIMVPTLERRASTVKADVDDRIPSSVPLRCAEAIMDYRPIDVAHKVAPSALMIIAVADDATTPTEHAEGLYERATAPKKLIMQRHTTHCAAYKQYGPAVIPQMVDWYRTHFTAGSVDLVRRAKERGVNVSCEVNHGALFPSRWADLERLGPYALSYWCPTATARRCGRPSTTAPSTCCRPITPPTPGPRRRWAGRTAGPATPASRPAGGGGLVGRWAGRTAGRAWLGPPQTLPLPKQQHCGVVLGLGAGTFDHEFDVVDMASIDRIALVRSI